MFSKDSPSDAVVDNVRSSAALRIETNNRTQEDRQSMSLFVVRFSSLPFSDRNRFVGIAILPSTTLGRFNRIPNFPAWQKTFFCELFVCAIHFDSAIYRCD